MSRGPKCDNIMSIKLEDYLKSGMENILRGALYISGFNLKQNMFMAGFVRSCKEASARRERYNDAGEHIPLINDGEHTGGCVLFE